MTDLGLNKHLIHIRLRNLVLRTDKQTYVTHPDDNDRCWIHDGKQVNKRHIS